jgi:hypothetical protein
MSSANYQSIDIAPRAPTSVTRTKSLATWIVGVCSVVLVLITASHFVIKGLNGDSVSSYVLGWVAPEGYSYWDVPSIVNSASKTQDFTQDFTQIQNLYSPNAVVEIPAAVDQIAVRGRDHVLHRIKGMFCRLQSTLLFCRHD